LISLNEIKTKQWLIERIEHVLIAFGQGLEANKQKFEKYSDDHISDIKSLRNGILSGIASAAALLVSLAAITSTTVLSDSIKSFLLEGTLVVSLPLGLLIYFVMVIKIRHESAKLQKIEKAYLDGFTSQKFIQGFVAMRTFDLNKISEDQLNTLYLYLVVIESGITCNIMNEYDKTNARKYLEYQNQAIRLYEKVARIGYNLYNNLLNTDKHFFTSDDLKGVFGKEAAVFLNEFNKFIDPLIDRFRNEDSKRLIQEASKGGSTENLYIV
jgi:hypothetical protein